VASVPSKAMMRCDPFAALVGVMLDSAKTFAPAAKSPAALSAACAEACPPSATNAEIPTNTSRRFISLICSSPLSLYS